MPDEVQKRCKPCMLVCPSMMLALVYTFFIRPWHLRWGATDEEVNRAMPGDDLIKRPSFNATRAVTVAAKPEEIWPWLLQIGHQRAGWYSYDWIDNQRVPSAERIIPELQHMEVGDTVPLLKTSSMTVEAIEPHRSMLWVQRDAHGAPPFTWAWGLYELDEHHTRLITRLRVRYHWTFPGIVLNLLIFDFGDFVMMRKCLLGIKRRAEALAEKGQENAHIQFA